MQIIFYKTFKSALRQKIRNRINYLRRNPSNGTSQPDQDQTEPPVLDEPVLDEQIAQPEIDGHIAQPEIDGQIAQPEVAQQIHQPDDSDSDDSEIEAMILKEKLKKTFDEHSWVQTRALRAADMAKNLPVVSYHSQWPALFRPEGVTFSSHKKYINYTNT